MTFKTTVTDTTGTPIPFAIVVANDEETGASFSRGTDGNGYADVDVKATPVGRPMTLTVQAAGYLNDIRYPTTTQADQVVSVRLSPFRKPFRAAPRLWKGQMCGLNIKGLPFVPGMEGAPAGLFLSWFYDRLDDYWRGVARAEMAKAKYTHWLVSWPDSQAFGKTPQQFKAMCQELIAYGFFPCPMLCAKPTSASDIRDIHGTLANIMLVLPLLVGLVPLYCIGWELSLWLSPTDVQFLIDTIAPLVVPQARLYVHFQEGYGSFQQPGKFFADFWNVNVGKLTGILRQEILSQNPDQRRNDSGGIVDVLIRFAGNAGVSRSSGFGHPFDDVELEISAQDQFNGTVSEAQGDVMGTWAFTTPAQSGPAGSVGVMGSGNGLVH